VKTNKGELTILRFLRTGIARTGLIFKKNVDILTWCKIKKVCLGRPVSGGYHTLWKLDPMSIIKIMIPAQHWELPSVKQQQSFYPCLLLAYTWHRMSLENNGNKFWLIFHKVKCTSGTRLGFRNGWPFPEERFHWRGDL
jgi:hypothetical protein